MSGFTSFHTQTYHTTGSSLITSLDIEDDSFSNYSKLNE